MKIHFQILLLLLLSSTTYAQFGGFPASGGGTKKTTAIPGTDTDTRPKGNAKIVGYVVDSTLSKAVEFVSVALYNKTTNKAVDGTVADEKGKFVLKNIVAGNYKILISFLGYQNKTIDNLNIEKGQELDLGVIKLSSSSTALDEVTVTGQKNLIEEKVDRLVYNAEKDIASKGGDATDVLRKVPMLNVDLDGNVSLRGSSNIKVLINNKPSTIVASSVADALKQIPADMIKTVEVITSPSAKYDAEGSGGIINIITKKNTMQGLTLNVDSGVGNRGSNLSLNGSYRQGKIGFTVGGFGRAFYNKSIMTVTQTTTDGQGNASLTKQSADAFDNGMFGRYNLGMDYDISKNQSITAGVNFGLRNFSRDQRPQTTDIFLNNVLKSSFMRNINSSDLSNTVDVNVDYLRTYKPQQELSVSTLYSRSNLTNDFTSNLLNLSGSDVQNRLKNINGNINQELTIQTDYQTPITKKQLIEFGVKGIFRQVNSDYRYMFANSATSDYATDIKNPSGNLDYTQQVKAAYISYTATTKSKYTFKLGSRFENTHIEAYQSGKGNIQVPDYNVLVPSINVSKTVSTGITLKAAYNRRIQRPGLQQLNPNVNQANLQSISVGNPNLKPELTDNFELGLSANVKKLFVNLSLFAKQTNNAITQIRTPSDSIAGAVVTTYQNIGKQQNIGANLFGNVNITPKWSVSGGLNFDHVYLEGQTTALSGLSTAVTNSGYNVSGMVMTQMTLKNGWGLQAFSFFRGRNIQLQGYMSGMMFYSLGVKKEFKNKKGSLGLAAENFLTNGMNMNIYVNTPQITQATENRILNQGIKLTFSYKIGKMSFDAPKRKTKSVNNDDLKAGDDNGGGGSAAPAGGRRN